jgi:ketosteroid isomerase-like protein
MMPDGRRIVRRLPVIDIMQGDIAMKTIKAALLGFALVVASAAPAVADDKADMEAAASKLAAAYAAADVAAIANTYTEDAALLPPNEARVDGRANIAEYWKAGFGMGVSDIKLTPKEINTSGDLAYEIGDFSYSARDKSGAKVTGTGKYLTVWKKVGGGWQLHRDIWNDNPAK